MVRRLLQLNGLAILAVIVFHAVGMGFVAMFAWYTRYLPPTALPGDQIGSLTYYILRLFEQLAVYSIPIFLFVSGFFMAVAAGKSRVTVSWEIINGRLKTLLVPYFIWSAVIMGLLFIQGNRFSLGRLVLNLLIGRSNEVMYFVPLLVQFYLLSPFLVPLARNKWKLLLVVTGMIQLLVQLTAYPVFLGLDIPYRIELFALVPKWLFLSRILWFPLGIVFGFHIEQFKQFLFRYRRAWVLIALVCIPIGVAEWEIFFHLSGETWLPARETLTDSIFGLAFLASFFAYQEVALPFSRHVEKVGQRSYGIYLTHAIAIELSAKIIYHVAPGLLAYQVVFVPMMIVVGLGAPMLLMTIVDRSPLRRYYKTLFG